MSINRMSIAEENRVNTSRRPQVIAQFILLLHLLPAVPAAQSGPEQKAAQSQAQVCVDATVKGDIEKVVDLTHPKVITTSGGRQNLISATLKKRNAIEQQGVTYVSGRADAPSTIYMAESGIYCVVPVVYRVRAGENKLIMKSPLIGVSTDSGKTWKFLDTSPGESVVRKVFPEIPKELKFPPDEELQVEP